MRERFSASGEPRVERTKLKVYQLRAMVRGMVRHIALNLLNLLKAEKTTKVGVKVKRLKCGWNEE